MQGGDLDNRVPSRMLVVFEGVIAQHETPGRRVKYEFYARTGAWRRAVRTFTVDPHSAKMLWHLAWQQSLQFDVASFLHERAMDEVQRWLEIYGLPFSNLLHFEDPGALARQLAYMPSVSHVVHANPDNKFTYGSRGLLVSGRWTV